MLKHLSSKVKIIFDLKDEYCVEPMSNKINVKFLFWSDASVQPKYTPCFRAYGYTFSTTTHFTGIALGHVAVVQ